jgi:putative transposase
MQAKKPAPSGPLLLTGSVYRRVSIFRYPEACEIFLRTLEAYRRKYGIKVYAFVLMPDHYHLLISFPADRSLAGFLRDFKSLAGKQILEWLKDCRLPRLLANFHLNSDRQRGKDPTYCVLQYRNHVKRLPDYRAIVQKLAYIHLNPVRAGLAAKEEDYAYSSARVYAKNGASVLKIEFPE